MYDVLLLRQGREPDTAVSAVLLYLCACLISVARHVNVMCACALWACAYQQCIFSLITGHNCGHGPATASRCWIQHSIFPVTNPVRNIYTNFRDSNFYTYSHQIFCRAVIKF